MASMALVGLIEEMIFRGFLFEAMRSDSDIRVAIIVSAVTFGLGHIVNLFTGHFGVETFVQMVYAISIGFIMVFVYYKGESLLPCIIAHSLIDIFSVISNLHGTIEWVYLGATIVIAITYCIYLVKKIPALDLSEKR